MAPIDYRTREHTESTVEQMSCSPSAPWVLP